MHKKCVLLISCSVGYGHQAAAMNIEQHLREENPEFQIIRLDTRQYFPPIIGKISDQWDSQMRKGNFEISQIVNLQSRYEDFYARFLDWNLSRDLAKLFESHNITKVYDTQPMFTPILYKAFSKACPDRQLIYHKILTDLPTPRNLSFFTGISRIEKQDNVFLKVHAPAPMLEPDQTPDTFWQKHCNLSLSQIDNTFALPVHPSYLKRPSDPNHLSILTPPEWELNSPLPPDAHVTTFMLGSQGINAIYDYAKVYLAQLSQQPSQQTHYCFIACSKNKELYGSLQRLLLQHPLHRNTPHRVIPLPMQSMDAVASLMWRSNQIVIRSGGISSIEQLALSQGRADHPVNLWIHSAYKGNDPTICLDHTYAWERGNAEYLMHHLGAKMTAPQLIDFFV